MPWIFFFFSELDLILVSKEHVHVCVYDRQTMVQSVHGHGFHLILADIRSTQTQSSVALGPRWAVQMPCHKHMDRSDWPRTWGNAWGQPNLGPLSVPPHSGHTGAGTCAIGGPCQTHAICPLRVGVTLLDDSQLKSDWPQKELHAERVTWQSLLSFCLWTHGSAYPWSLRDCSSLSFRCARPAEGEEFPSWMVWRAFSQVIDLRNVLCFRGKPSFYSEQWCKVMASSLYRTSLSKGDIIIPGHAQCQDQQCGHCLGAY